MHAFESLAVADKGISDLLRQAKPRTSRALVDLIVWSWGMLLVGVAAYVIHPSWWTFIIAFSFVTSRMGALLALAHEAQHAAFLPSKKWNDLVAAWLCAYPVGSIFGSSRAVHMAHHKLLGTSDDPDRNFHREDNKSTPRDFVVHFARLIFGGQLWTSIVVNGILRPMRKENDKASPVVLARKGHPEILNLIPVQLVIWGLLWLASGQWWLYLALWLLPIFTTGTFLGFLRGFVDHARLAGEKEGPMEGRLVTVLKAGVISKAFLCPFDFNYHAEHHMFPSVPHYFLPELHKRMQACDSVKALYLVRPTYSQFLLDYWRQISQANSSVAPVSEHGESCAS